MVPELKVLIGDCRDLLRQMPEASVQCVVTSPPYWGLRDYGIGGIGAEQSPHEYVMEITEVFSEVRRVLRDDGTLWLNLGDGYVGGSNLDKGGIAEKFHARSTGEIVRASEGKAAWRGLPRKNLLGMPWRVAFALQEDDWILRSDIIWAKRNAMPSSVTDRPTSSHEYVFLFSKSHKYFYDHEAVKGEGKKGQQVNLRDVWWLSTQPYKGAHFATFPESLVRPCIRAGTSELGCCSKCGTPFRRQTKRELCTANKTEAYAEGLGGTSYGLYSRGGFKGGSSETVGWTSGCNCGVGPSPCTVLDPFAGSGTTAKVALAEGRSAIAIEANAEYGRMIERRCAA